MLTADFWDVFFFYFFHHFFWYELPEVHLQTSIHLPEKRVSDFFLDSDFLDKYLHEPHKTFPQTAPQNDESQI